MLLSEVWGVMTSRTPQNPPVLARDTWWAAFAREVLQRKLREAESSFKAVRSDMERKLAAADAPPRTPRRTCERQMYRGTSVNEDAAPEDSFRVNIFIPFPDDLISQLETRFFSKEVAVVRASRLIRPATLCSLTATASGSLMLSSYKSPSRRISASVRPRRSCSSGSRCGPGRRGNESLPSPLLSSAATRISVRLGSARWC